MWAPPEDPSVRTAAGSTALPPCTQRGAALRPARAQGPALAARGCPARSSQQHGGRLQPWCGEHELPQLLAAAGDKPVRFSPAPCRSEGDNQCVVKWLFMPKARDLQTRLREWGA